MKKQPIARAPNYNKNIYPFNPAKAEAIVAFVAEGNGLRAACQHVGVPCMTPRQWMRDNQEFREAVHRARMEGYEVWADEIMSIGDEVAGCSDNSQVQAARLRVDSRKWILSKLQPERYGDRVELTGKDGRDLLPPAESAIPRLMTVLAVLMPQASNTELHALATTITGKVNSNGMLPALTHEPE